MRKTVLPALFIFASLVASVATAAPLEPPAEMAAKRYVRAFQQTLQTYARAQRMHPLTAPADLDLSQGLNTIPPGADISYGFEVIDEDSALLCLRVSPGSPPQRAGLFAAAARLKLQIKDDTCKAAIGPAQAGAAVLSLASVMHRSQVLVLPTSVGGQPLLGADLLGVYPGQLSTVVLTNASAVPLEIASMSLSSAFTVASNNCEAELLPLAQCQVQIELAPAAPARAVVVGRFELKTNSDTRTVVPLRLIRVAPAPASAEVLQITAQ